MADTTHKCPREGCERQVPFHILACPQHWAMVTPETKRRVNHAWLYQTRESYLEAHAQAVKEINSGR